LRASEEMLTYVFLASYSDFIIVGMLHFLKVIDEKIYERIVGMDDSFAKVYDACKPWLKRDDH
jgi:hypothetical protein